MTARIKVGESIPPLDCDSAAVGLRCWQCGGKFGIGSLTTMVYVMQYEPFAVHIGCLKSTIARLEGYPIEEGTDMADGPEEEYEEGEDD